MSELDILKLVARRLNDAGIDYMLSGSVALTFYGKPRMTRDIDIVVMIPIDEVQQFITLFEQDFYIDKDYGDGCHSTPNVVQHHSPGVCY